MKIYLVDHESSFSFFFQILIIFSSTYTSFFYANIAAHKHYYMEHGLPVTDYIFELIFAFDFLLKFITTYNDVDKNNNRIKIYDIKKIVINFYETTFWQELIPLIPFQLLSKYNEQFMLAFILKIFRIKKGIVLLNVSKVVSSVKDLQHKNIDRQIANGTIDPEFVNEIHKLKENWT